MHWVGRVSPRSAVCISLIILGFLPLTCAAQTAVLTYHNDNARTGQNLTETQLTPANVNASSFGKLFNLAVDGKVDAQPLYVPGLQIPNSGTHNVVFVATEHDSVYAFDSDNGTKLWQVSMLKAGETTSDARNCNQVIPEIGVTATPVIDLKAEPNGTIYVVAMSKDASGNYYQRLHALNLATGAEQSGGPVDIHATYPGTGDVSSNGSVVFDPKQYKDRAALLLLNGVVYTSWTSHCDIQPYTGWLIGYDENTLAQTSVFNFAPNGSGNAVWSSGSGPATDGNGNIFVSLANGTFDTTLNAQGFPNQGDFGNAFVKLILSGGALQAADYWTMHNTVAESDSDGDLASGGLVLLPDQTDASGAVRHLGIGAGKDQHIYVFDRDNMGKFNPNDNSNIYQDISGALAQAEFGTPAWFNGTVYFGAVGDAVKAFPMTAAKLATTPSSSTAEAFPYPGITPSISASGNTNGILWAVENANTAVLHAYDATNLGKELYNSNQAGGGRDSFGAGNKFIVPTVADGKVFVGTQNSVAVFGLFAPPAASAAATTTSLSASAAVANAGSSVTFTAKVTAAAGIPGGSVTFNDGATSIGTAALDATGTATLATTALAAGVHSITASYAGTAGFSPSTSDAVTITVVGGTGASFQISPVSVPPGVTMGTATLTWSAPGTTTVEIHLGAVDGPLFALGGSTGSAQTGAWVTDGMVFFLQDVSNGKTLSAANTLAIATAKLQQEVEAGSLLASPNPIPAAPGTFGSTSLSWNTSTASQVEVHVGAPAGPLFAAGGPQGSANASGWVTDGMMFFLQDVSLGQPLTTQFTIATQTLSFTPTSANVSFQASPNPAIVMPGTSLGTMTLYWSVAGASTVQIHVGTPDGPLFAEGGSQGSAKAEGWVSDGMIFYLEDVSGGKAPTTLATVTARLMSLSAQ